MGDLSLTFASFEIIADSKRSESLMKDGEIESPDFVGGGQRGRFCGLA